jgi:hypothetical protein
MKWTDLAKTDAFAGRAKTAGLTPVAREGPINP